jgi:SAM-dependent methyltransferase
MKLPADVFKTLNFAARGYHGQAYFKECEPRFRSVLGAALKHIGDNATGMSLGAGGAFVEEVLVRHCGCTMDVVDFREVIERNKSLYAALGMNCIPSDITKDTLELGASKYDLILWLDNIEHLAIDPVPILEALQRSLKTNGKLIITTDNFASLKNVARLCVGRSIIAPPAALFSPICFENEGVHRREYTARELMKCCETAGFRSISIERIWNHDPLYHLKRRHYVRSLMNLVEFAIPAWRPHMLLIGGR